MDPYQEGIDAYLTLQYATPIHALAKHAMRFSKDEMFKFADGFWYADKFLK